MKPRTPCTRPEAQRRGHPVHRDRYNIPDPDDSDCRAVVLQAGEDNAEMRYLQERRKAWGYLPAAAQRQTSTSPVPALETFKAILEPTGEGEISTTRCSCAL